MVLREIPTGAFLPPQIRESANLLPHKGLSADPREGDGGGKLFWSSFRGLPLSLSSSCARFSLYSESFGFWGQERTRCLLPLL